MCGECAIQSVEPGVRNARYGLRGVRVGGGQPPRSHTFVDEVLDNLELALTMIDSDDEPLTRVAHSRRDGQVGEVCRGHHQAAPQSTVDDSDVGVPDAFVGTPSMLVSCRATRGIFSTSEEVAHSAGSRRR